MNIKRRAVFLVVGVIYAIATLVVVVLSYTDKTSPYLPPEEFKPEPRLSINRFINNEMSDLEQTAKFDRAIESFMRRWEFTGVSFALMRNDSLIYAKGYGYADKGREVKCDASNVFRIASVSKLITATAIMKLVEQEKLTLSSQVFGDEGILNDSIFLDLRSKNLEQITVEHLLRHTAGFSSPHGDPAFANITIAKHLDKPLPLSVDDMVLYATKNRLRSRPGGSYDYSNLGYIILGKIIEKVSGEGYESYVQSQILAPIGCYDMFIGENYSRNKAHNEVRYYEVKEAEPVESSDGSGRITMKSDGGNNVTLLSSAGGWVASSAELLKFVAAVNDCSNREGIISRESIKKMSYSDKKTHPIGWASTSQSSWLRSGSMAGTSALVKRQSDGYTWVFIVNNSAWIGPKITRYISTYVTNALAKVSEWPERDLFELSDR